VARRLADIGVTWASLTDHNTIDGQDEFRAALQRYGITYLPGVEVDARSPFGPLHVLGYGIDLGYEPLRAVLQAIRQPWRHSARHWLGRFHVLRQEPAPATTACFPPKENEPRPGPLTTARAICLIHEAGGQAFLAHPLESLRSFKRLEDALDQLQPEGLDGLEVFHRSYPEGVQSALLALAVRRGLAATGGSDFHGLDHSDGASLGVDVPVEQWQQMMRLFGKKQGPAIATVPGTHTTI
jgi:3',5'-nucleoside bisphosphate phosphatase